LIVPSKSLLRWTAFGLTPLLGVTVLAGAAAAGVAVAAGFLALLGLDALLSGRRLHGVRLTEQHARIRLYKGRAGAIPVELAQEGPPTPALRLALALPHVFTSPEPHVRFHLPADGGPYRVDWPCLPLQRGEFTTGCVGLETSSLLGLWLLRRRLPLALTLRVYPDLEQEYRSVTLLMRGTLEGSHMRRQIGRGREFEQLREYLPGDTYANIHWKTSAKRCHPITKMYRTERSQEIYVLIDSSRLSARTMVDHDPDQGPVTMLERYVTATLMLAAATERQGDFFGCIEFNDRVQRIIPAGRGSAHFNTCRDALYGLHAEPVSPDFMDVAAFVRTRLRKRALLVYLTSLDDPLLAEQFIQSVDLICRHHLVVANVLSPTRVQPVFAGAPAQSLPEVYQRLAGHTFWQRLRETARLLHARHVHMEQLEDERLSADLIRQYMTIKQRQLL